MTDAEYKNLKSQIVISSWGGMRRANPYAFTEQGVAIHGAAAGTTKTENRFSYGSVNRTRYAGLYAGLWYNLNRGCLGTVQTFKEVPRKLLFIVSSGSNFL